MAENVKTAVENARSLDELHFVLTKIVSLEDLKYFLLTKLERDDPYYKFEITKTSTKNEIIRKCKLIQESVERERQRILREQHLNTKHEREVRLIMERLTRKSPKPKDLSLRHKLKTTEYLNKTPKHLMPAIATKILQVLQPETIQTLPTEWSLQVINHSKDIANVPQIQQMNKIISSINAEYRNTKRKQAKDDNVKGAALNNNSFSVISNSSITNITNYLTKNDVSSFKAASRRMAIICLEQMEKYEIMTMNMNELVDIKYSKYYSNYMNIENELKVNRCCGNRTVSYLKEAWSKQYNIKEEDLLLYPAEISQLESGPCDEDDMFEYYQPCDECISFANEQQKVCNLPGSCNHRVKCFIFDKSAMIQIDQNGKICDFVAGEEIEFHDWANRKLLKTLLYYDRSTNEISPIQHIMAHEDVTGNQLAGYIQNGFVAKNEKQRLFQSKFEEQRKKLNGDKLFLYIHDPQWKFQTDYTFWTKIWDENERMSGCNFQTVIFSLGSIEIANYPKLGELRAYYSGYDTHKLNSWFGYLDPDEYE